jgi:hypothetical protein
MTIDGAENCRKNDRRQFLKKTILKLLLVGFLKPWVNAIKILFHDNIGKKNSQLNNIQTCDLRFSIKICGIFVK